MARFFAAILAAAAMFQVGSAAPYPFTNSTGVAAPATPHLNTTVSPEVLKRQLRNFPIALRSIERRGPVGRRKGIFSSGRHQVTRTLGNSKWSTVLTSIDVLHRSRSAPTKSAK
ncbi:hypothetical protein GGR52DRAFT_576478 [Hypoxylon sp. FL1284]|nr:hypothetical protein GGR52DRAFT_576478 [Hypoxylon sp. FL1284]